MKVYNVLSLVGGGYKGLFQARILEEVEKKLGKPLWESFDLIAGTSIGAITGFALSLGYTAGDIKNLFLGKGREIFYRDWKQKAITLNGLTGAKYQKENIENFLLTIFSATLMKECKTKIMATSFDLAGMEGKLFKSWKEPDTQIFHAVRASSAAATFFPAYEHNGMILTDGGFLANDPTLIAYTQARKMWGQDVKINMLTIGSEKIYRGFDERIINAGLSKWAVPVSSVLLGISGDTEYIVQNGIASDLNICLRLDIEKQEAGYFEAVDMDDVSDEAIERHLNYALRVLEAQEVELDAFVEEMRQE